MTRGELRTEFRKVASAGRKYALKSINDGLQDPALRLAARHITEEVDLEEAAARMMDDAADTTRWLLKRMSRKVARTLKRGPK
jgi:hypothetical protein